jgi:glycosyltransferase involved in cell wall biosynthesis
MTAGSMGVGPSVSIGCPVYNGEALIEQALDSLLAQDHKDFELIISDNGSSDGTQRICEAYAARDTRIVYHRSDVNRGAVWNFNRVFQLSRGLFFMWGAHDDLWHPAFVSRCVEWLRADPAAAICHSYAQPFLRSGEPVGETYAGWVNDGATAEARWRTVTRDWRLCAATYGLMRRSIAARTRLLQIAPAADLIFIAEMSIHGTIIQVPEVLQWKRVPDPDRRYHTPQSMLAYLGHPRPRPGMLRLQVSWQLLRGLRHARLGVWRTGRMAWIAIVSYVAKRYWLIDLKEWAAAWVR